MGLAARNHTRGRSMKYTFPTTYFITRANQDCRVDDKSHRPEDATRAMIAGIRSSHVVTLVKRGKHVPKEGMAILAAYKAVGGTWSVEYLLLSNASNSDFSPIIFDKQS